MRNFALCTWVAVGLLGCHAKSSATSDGGSASVAVTLSTSPDASLTTVLTPPSAVPSSPAPSTTTAGLADASAMDPALVRQEKKVTVDGIVETWRLVWRAPPKLSCVDEHWNTCLCGRLAYGETGELDLVRSRPNEPDERLDITYFFRDIGEMTIPRWPTKEGDPDKVNIAEIKKRPSVDVMKLGDYDHDGRATELVIQLDAGNPCGRSTSMLVGITKHWPRLHAFGTVDAPSSRLTLYHFDDWEEIRVKGSTTLTEIACGDHGAEEEETLRVTVEPLGFRAAKRTRKCAP